MTYRKRTLRTMSPVTRKLARLAGEAGSLERRLKTIVKEVQSLEHDSRALRNHSCKAVVENQSQDIEEIFDDAEGK